MTAATTQHSSELADLVRDHQAGLWRYLRFLGSDAAEADDLVQETFLTVFRARPEFNSPRAAAAYLRQVARNRLLAVRQRAGREPGTADLDLAEAVWAEASGDDGLNGYLDALKTCLEVAIGDRAREAIDLRYREGLSREAMADRLAMKADGVKTLLRRARVALRECVERKVVSRES